MCGTIFKAHHLAHQTFTDATALDRSIHAAVEALNRERTLRTVGRSENLCLGYFVHEANVQNPIKDILDAFGAELVERIKLP